MAEYIEREAVLDLLTNRDVVINPNDEVANIREDIECLPAADVRPVVLCRNCRSYNKPRPGFCETHLVRMHGDDFCSYGKKKEETC